MTFSRSICCVSVRLFLSFPFVLNSAMMPIRAVGGSAVSGRLLERPPPFERGRRDEAKQRAVPSRQPHPKQAAASSTPAHSTATDTPTDRTPHTAPYTTCLTPRSPRSPPVSADRQDTLDRATPRRHLAPFGRALAWRFKFDRRCSSMQTLQTTTTPTDAQRRCVQAGRRVRRRPTATMRAAHRHEHMGVLVRTRGKCAAPLDVPPLHPPTSPPICSPAISRMPAASAALLSLRLLPRLQPRRLPSRLPRRPSASARTPTHRRRRSPPTSSSGQRDHTHGDGTDAQ